MRTLAALLLPALLLAFIAAITNVAVSRVDRRLVGIQSTVEDFVQQLPDFSLSWQTDLGGGALGTVTVSKYQMPGESDADFAERCSKAVDAMKAKFPPAPN